MSEHTPGPWTVVSEGMASPKVVDANGLGICHTTYAPTGAEANARLIAAAPELLEVVQKLVAWSEAERDPSGTTFWQRVEMCREVDALASAAIAKATGEPA